MIQMDKRRVSQVGDNLTKKKKVPSTLKFKRHEGSLGILANTATYRLADKPLDPNKTKKKKNYYINITDVILEKLHSPLKTEFPTKKQDCIPN